ncbi:AraC family transcriptional regulator [Kribbella sp. CA-293567]|uniref:AraC family transcriptional regulator n=1 Tax=Kribbella sp. CA-293567 TaxID=3002436 RepID=UPI0022DD0213|nr:AraC family transcriptional regulator [Kribbella sp. CA-293567]WBQ05482.1 AraC family transcriptional regulator [Kribbella sp. CA-293567]
MPDSRALMTELRDLIAAHARPDLRTSIDGLFVSRMESSAQEHSLTEPLLVVMAQGGKQLLLGDQIFEYRAGQLLLVTADLPITGHFIEATPQTPALGLGLVLRPATIAPLLLESAAGQRGRATPNGPAMATGDASPELLDASVRLLRLLDSPADAPVLGPMIEREILWRLLTGPHAEVIRQIGLADSSLTHISRAIRWIRDNYAEPMRVADLARLAGMSPAAFHRHFRAITALSPLQFQKRIRLQEARSLLAAQPGDVAGVGHLVGYDSPSQFNREYRRLFGSPPGADAAQLRLAAQPQLP